MAGDRSRFWANTTVTNSHSKRYLTSEYVFENRNGFVSVDKCSKKERFHASEEVLVGASLRWIGGIVCVTVDFGGSVVGRCLDKEFP